MANLSFTLRIWRQARPGEHGRFVDYLVGNVSPNMSVLETIEVINEDLIRKGQPAIDFDSDCREGICGSCGVMVNGLAHGPDLATTTCQTYMRRFVNGSTILVEPWRARAFPLVKDLIVDRSAFDRIIAAGGYVSNSVGAAPEANTIPIPADLAEKALDSAACIGCGACVAACKNASAHLFTGAKISHLALLPQGRVERADRARRMVQQMDREGFGACSNEGECEAACPKSVPITNIARMIREYVRASLRGDR
jgi:succinate dehydrogenase / fumarate reductase iron-sulfur subunit